MDLSGVSNRVKSYGMGVCSATEAVVRGTLGVGLLSGAYLPSVFIQTAIQLSVQKLLEKVFGFNAESRTCRTQIWIDYTDALAIRPVKRMAERQFKGMCKASRASYRHFWEVIIPTPPSYTQRLWSYLNGK